jgi:hypothetical protein
LSHKISNFSSKGMKGKLFLKQSRRINIVLCACLPWIGFSVTKRGCYLVEWPPCRQRGLLLQACERPRRRYRPQHPATLVWNASNDAPSRTRARPTWAAANRFANLSPLSARNLPKCSPLNPDGHSVADLSTVLAARR